MHRPIATTLTAVALAATAALTTAPPASATIRSRTCTTDPWYTARKTASVALDRDARAPGDVTIYASTWERNEYPSLDMTPHLRVRVIIGGVVMRTWRESGTTGTGVQMLPIDLAAMPAHYTVTVRAVWSAPGSHLPAASCTVRIAL